MKNRLISTTLAALAGVGLISSIAACGGGQVASAEVGECIVTSELGEEITEIPTVDCGEAHDAQVVGKFDLDDGDFPGLDAIKAAADEGCVTEFESFIGAAYDESSLEVSYIHPTEDTWNQADDREVLCFAVSAEDATESWEGSGI
ncbi:septum formation family protein [Pseudactinotalea suaedae]|uniref:septum formation family protein n=1 Tax=Pseudactinotalea suaedae TaxID=1524924 RepID=UPI0012E11753|nr:septum formation family protein [Pseudactinotalea suaedae]